MKSVSVRLGRTRSCRLGARIGGTGRGGGADGGAWSQSLDPRRCLQEPCFDAFRGAVVVEVAATVGQNHKDVDKNQYLQ